MTPPPPPSQIGAGPGLFSFCATGSRLAHTSFPTTPPPHCGADSHPLLGLGLGHTLLPSSPQHRAGPHPLSPSWPGCGWAMPPSSCGVKPHFLPLWGWIGAGSCPLFAPGTGSSPLPQHDCIRAELPPTLLCSWMGPIPATGIRLGPSAGSGLQRDWTLFIWLAGQKG